MLLEETNVFVPKKYNPQFLSNINPDYVYSYEELRAIYENNPLSLDPSDNTEYMLNASIEFDEVMELLKAYEDAPLNEWVTGTKHIAIREFKITKTDDDYVLIATRIIGRENVYARVFKVGLKEDNLQLEHMTYMESYYQKGQDVNFKYFRFYQNQDTLFILNNTQEHILDFVDFTTNEIVYVINNTNEFDLGNDYITYYNPETNIYISRGYDDSDLTYERISLYNTYGMYFSYSDHDQSDDLFTVTYNMMETTGWTYAYYEQNNNTENGIYKGLDKLLENELLSISIQEENDVDIYLTRVYNTLDITSDEFDLSNENLLFYQGDITLPYIQTLRDIDKNDLLQQSIFETIDFFGDTVRYDLYYLINEDLKEIMDHIKD